MYEPGLQLGTSSISSREVQKGMERKLYANLNVIARHSDYNCLVMVARRPWTVQVAGFVLVLKPEYHWPE